MPVAGRTDAELIRLSPEENDSMKRALSIPVFLTFALSALASNDQRMIVAKLSLPHSKILPGVPFEINVSLENRSTRSATVGLRVNVFVRPETGTEVRLPSQAVLDPHSYSVPVDID